MQDEIVAQLANQTAVRFGDAKPLAPRTGAIVPLVEKTATVGPPLWSRLPRAGPRLLRLERMTAAEVLGNFLHGHPLDSRVGIDVADQSLQHEQHLRPAGHVRVDGYGENGVVHFPVHPVEFVAPHLFDIARIDETVAVRGPSL